jgi:hypothetical protein
MTMLIEWGHNPGQRFVKDSLTIKGKRKDLRPYPAVIAPWAQADDTGLTRRSRDLTAKVGGATYIGGEAAERLPLANRQQSRDRLDPESPIYGAFAQMSAQHAGLAGFHNGSRPQVLIATALPVAWKLDDQAAAAHLEAHLRRALGDQVVIKGIVVQSEPNALVSSELLDDEGQARPEQKELASGLVCVGDIGGGTANRTVLEKLKALPSQSASPDLGSSQVVRDLAQRSGMQYVDAERRLERAVAAPGQDPQADALLKQYREAVISDFQQAWKIFPANALRLFGGGTAHWLAAELPRVWPRVRIVANPQQAIAIGLWRYARRKARRGGA